MPAVRSEMSAPARTVVRLVLALAALEHLIIHRDK